MGLSRNCSSRVSSHLSSRLLSDETARPSQNRPEFHRRVFTSTWRYLWAEPHHHTTYRFDLVDLNYVYMPWISKTFKEDYLDDVSNRNAILRYNYEDLFIMKIGAGLTYNDGTNMPSSISTIPISSPSTSTTRSLSMQGLVLLILTATATSCRSRNAISREEQAPCADGV